MDNARSNPEAPARLRVGLMLGTYETPRWVAAIVDELLSSDFVEIALVFLPEQAPPQRPNRWQNRRHLLFSLYSRLDYQFFRRRLKHDAFAKVDLTDRLRGIPTIRTRPNQKGPVQRFPADDIAQVEAANLDVLLRFGFRIIKGQILQAARYGIWSYHHDDNREYRGAPAAFWEMYEGNPLSGCILQILTEKLDGGHVLYRSWSSTHPTSLVLNRNQVYWKTTQFVIRRLRDLYQHGFSYLTALDTYTEQEAYTKGIYRTPTNGQMVRHLARLGLNMARRTLRLWLFKEQWFLATRPRDRMGAQAYHIIRPPRDRFYADPFLFTHDGRRYLFFEDYRYALSKGLISVVEIDENGRPLGDPQVVLERDHHLSYPCVFAVGDQIYMIPETAENRTVELYRCVEFPHAWERERTLLENVYATDATMLQHDGRFWLFVAMPAVPGAAGSDELFLFHAESLAGPWQPHPRNPIVSDVRRARPAGGLYWENNELIRPAQDCSVRYGYAVVRHRIDELTPTTYAETPLDRIERGWHPGNLGSHTYARGGGVEVLDGRVWIRK